MTTHGGPINKPLPGRAVGRAALLAGAVHDSSATEVAEILDGLDRQELLDLAVTLAAMVPVEYSPGDLLAWNDSSYTRTPAAPVVITSDTTGSVRTLQPHGTHAAFNRHKKRTETPCAACLEGERDFQRERARRRRAVSA